MNPSFLFTFLQILSFLFFPSIWRNTLRWSTNGDFFQTLGQQWDLSPGGISCYLVLGFTPSTTLSVHNDTISNEDCWVLLLWCRSTSHLTCHVSSISPIIYSYTVVQSHTCIHTFMHSFIHSYINNFHVVIHSCVHNIYTTSFIHGCISHLESCLAVSFQFGPHSSLCQAIACNHYLSFCAKWIACNYLFVTFVLS